MCLHGEILKEIPALLMLREGVGSFSGGLSSLQVVFKVRFACVLWYIALFYAMGLICFCF